MRKDLLAPADLGPADLTGILDLAAELKRNPRQRCAELKDELVALYFTKPATRLRVAFTTAAARLGTNSVVIGPAEFEDGAGVGVEDLAHLVSESASVVVARADDEDLRQLAELATIPVVAGLSDSHQPFQSLADLLTLRQTFGRLAGLRVAYLGDGGPLAHSLAEACALAGVELRLATSPTRPADAALVAGAHDLAVRHGGEVVAADDAFAAVEGADAVYSGGWTLEDDDGECWMTTYPVTRLLLACAAPEAVLLHTPPAAHPSNLSRRVLCDPRSRIREQAENRVHAAAAVLATYMSPTPEATTVDLISSRALVCAS